MCITQHIPLYNERKTAKKKASDQLASIRAQGFRLAMLPFRPPMCSAVCPLSRSTVWHCVGFHCVCNVLYQGASLALWRGSAPLFFLHSVSHCLCHCVCNVYASLCLFIVLVLSHLQQHQYIRVEIRIQVMGVTFSKVVELRIYPLVPRTHLNTGANTVFASTPPPDRLIADREIKKEIVSIVTRCYRVPAHCSLTRCGSVQHSGENKVYRAGGIFS